MRGFWRLAARARLPFQTPKFTRTENGVVFITRRVGATASFLRHNHNAFSSPASPFPSSSRSSPFFGFAGFIPFFHIYFSFRLSIFVTCLFGLKRYMEQGKGGACSSKRSPPPILRLSCSILASPSWKLEAPTSPTLVLLWILLSQNHFLELMVFSPIFPFISYLTVFLRFANTCA